GATEHDDDPSRAQTSQQAWYEFASFMFSLYCNRDHRDLHSFPTRRSSDLTPSPIPSPPTTTRLPRLLLRHVPGDDFVHRLARVRSEEHTSELQSQSNLVCRLLREKKKDNGP